MGEWANFKFRTAVLAVGTAALILIFGGIQFAGSVQPSGESLQNFPLQSHPLPPTLTQWQDPNQRGDYFSEVKPTAVGYLVWTEFPVQVYVHPSGTAVDRSQAWLNAVVEAVEEWAAYFPLEVVEQPELAQISIAQQRPPPQRFPDGTIRARSALTRYELYVRQDEAGDRQKLCHQFDIAISPTQTGEYVRAAVRHELGHALGLWGHSPVETDALYFSQVSTPPGISPRDINTLKQVYQQPTRLGWWV